MTWYPKCATANSDRKPRENGRDFDRLVPKRWKMPMLRLSRGTSVKDFRLPYSTFLSQYYSGSYYKISLTYKPLLRIVMPRKNKLSDIFIK